MTTPSQWRRVRSAFARIVDRSSATRPLDRLDAEFRSNPELKRHLVDLVNHHRSEDPLFDWAARSTDNLPSDPLFHEGQVLASRFRIVRFLGRGGMGEVYEAVDTTLHNCSVAIKTVSGDVRHNPDADRRFLREVELAQRVTHRNICRIHDIYPHACQDPSTGATQLTRFLTMQLLLGETLAEYVAHRGALPLNEALELLRQLADALEAAHSAGVIHRDFKPGNIILVQDRASLRPVITDFGVAVRTDRSLEAEPDHTLADYTRAGTPEYASPEQIKGGRVSAATDVFALGVVALEMLTGQTGDRSLAPLSPNQREAIGRCLLDDPAERFATPSEFVSALAGDPKPAPAPHSVVSRRVVLSGLGAAATVFGGAYLARKIWFPGAGISTLSILPFTGDSSVSALPGFQEELTRVFLRSKKLRIIAAYSTASLQPPFDIRKMANLLPADAFVTGALSAAEVLVTVVRRTGSIFWQQRFDRRQPAFSLHREIQTAVVAAVDKDESDSLLQSSYVPSQDGYLAYVTARSYLTRHSDQDLKQAAMFFREAIRHDAKFASAWAGLAYTLLLTGSMSEARASADHAITLDDRCPEAYLVKGIVLHIADWSWDAAQAAVKHALGLEPYNPRGHQWLGGMLSDLGKTAQSIPQLNLAIDLDPLAFNSKITCGVCLMYARQFDAAIDRLNQGVAAMKAAKIETVRPYPFLGTCWLMKGDKTKALQYYRDAVSMDPTYLEINAHYVFGAAKCGYLAEARETAERLTHFPDAALHPFYIGVAFLSIGETDRAFEYLNRAFATKDTDMPLLKSSIYMDPIRTDPRYLTLLAKMRFT